MDALFNNAIDKRRVNENYIKPRNKGGNACYGLLSSEWSYYKRQNPSLYPTAEAIRLQRKYETKYDYPHLYEVDGTVNRVRGINDSGINPTSRSSPSSSPQLSRSEIKFMIDSSSAIVGSERVRERVCERNVYPKYGGRPLSLEEIALLRQEAKC
jgi:hypothetical protein